MWYTAKLLLYIFFFSFLMSKIMQESNNYTIFAANKYSIICKKSILRALKT
jgi:hypothetical protein